MSEETEFPKTVEGFGYRFNEKGELRDIKTGGRFEFFYRTGDRYYNQRRYEELGDVIGEFIENELVKQYNLIRKIIPVELKEDDNIAKSRIYISDDAQECQTLLLLIQGSGVVRPGQWARQVIINDSLELGTMFPYIRKAQELKWGIVIFNPNENYGSIMKDDGEVGYRRIYGSESPQSHCLYVWDKFVKNARAKEILIVAHSYGGICTSYLLDQYAEDFYKRVKGIALTDSVHSSGMIPTHSKHWFSKKAINWIKSDLPMNDPIREADQFYGCSCFSAGHQKHEYTSGVAIEPVFEFLQFRSRGNKEITNQKNETSEQSVTNNNEDDKESRVIESLNEETKLQTQNASESITHEKGTNDMEIDELHEATNKTSSENDTKLDSSSAMETEATSSEKDTKATEESQLDSSSAMEMEVEDTSSEKDIKATGESQLDSSSTMETEAISSEKDTKATEESQLDLSLSMETEAEKDTKTIVEPHLDSSSTMETEATSSEKDTKATEESQLDSSSTMETEAISSEKDTKATVESHLDSSSAMETEATSSEKDTKTTAESQLDSSSAMETEEISSEKDTKATAESQLDSSSTMETEAMISEKDTKATEESQLDSSSDVKIVDETVATNVISSEKDTMAIEELTGSETPNAIIIMNEQVEKVAKATNETTTNLEKNTEKDTLKAFMNNAITNDEVTVKNDIYENEKINNNNIPKENTTDSNFNADAQALKDNNNSKDSSQNNNV